MRCWLRTWIGPIGWQLNEPGAGRHPLTEFVRAWGFLLAATLLCGLSGGLLNALGVEINVGAAVNAQQAVMTVALALFVAIQFRDAQAATSRTRSDVSNLVLRAAASSALFFGAALGVFLPAAGTPDAGLTALPSWLLYTALLAILRPLDGDFPREMAERELTDLRAVRTHLAEALGNPTDGVRTARFLRRVVLLSTLPALTVTLIVAWGFHSDAEAAVNGPVAIIAAWVLTASWFVLGETTVQLRAFARARAFVPLAVTWMRFVFIAVVLAIFLALGVGTVWLHFFGDSAVLPSQWLLAATSLVLSGLGITALWGWPSPRLAALSALTDVDTRICVLEERAETTAEFNI